MRVLLLTYSFPPVPLISAQRAHAFHRYLPNSNIKVVTVTRKWRLGLSGHDDLYKLDEGAQETFDHEDNKLIKVPFKRNVKYRLVGHKNWAARYLRKFITFAQTILQWHWLQISDYYPLYKVCKDVLSKEKFDAILVTGQPFVLFQYARKLSRRYAVPYILDYRDGWFTGHLSKSKGLKGLIRSFEYTQEAKVLANASGFISISKGLVNDIQRSFPNVPQHEVVINGVDEEVLWSARQSFLQNDKEIQEHPFEVVYTGTLNDKKRIDILLSGFRKYADTRAKDAVRLKLVGIGIRKNKYEPLIAKYQQEVEWLHILHAVSFETSLQIQMGAKVLIALIPGKLTEGIFTGKLFEYAASGRPVIVIENEDNSTNNSAREDNDLVKQLNLHICNDATTVASTLERLSNQKTNHSFQYPTWITRQYQTEILGKFLNSAIQST